MMFCIRTSMRQLSTGTYHVSYMQKFYPTALCCSFWHGEECGVAFLCWWVPLPNFPWPIQNNLVTVGCSRVCVGLLLARLCFNCVYWASSSVFAWASIATWRLFQCIVCTIVRVRGRFGTAVLFLWRKVAAWLSKWVCCRRWSCEAERWKYCKREEKKQLEALGW